MNRPDDVRQWLLSSAAYNGRVGLVLLCPITNQRKGYPFEIRIPRRLRVQGDVLADQIKSLKLAGAPSRVYLYLTG